MATSDDKAPKGASGIARLIDRAMQWWAYASDGVWSDSRPLWWVKTLKTINLAVRSFMDGDLQTQACAMTYRTMLAVVPALALLFAIGRGFGFQNLLEHELYNIFPAQHQAVGAALGFVDSYLKQASEGIFVGVGIVFLLWTLISLVSNIEEQFNSIWGVNQGRSIWRKITDYTAMLLILPVLMICASGLQLMMSSTIQHLFDFDFFTPIIDTIFEFASYAFTWLFFAVVYMLIPNTKVKFKNAIVAGIVCGTGFHILQWLFVTGQVYVSKYNAIYGSFSFLPLLLIWMQLAWMVCLCGAVLCYALQNVVRFNLINQLGDITLDYRERICLAVMAITVQRYTHKMSAPTQEVFVRQYAFPSRVCNDVISLLLRAQLVARVVIDEKKELYGLVPAFEPATLTVNQVRHALRNIGKANFIPGFDSDFHGVDQAVDSLNAQAMQASQEILINSLEIELK